MSMRGHRTPKAHSFLLRELVPDGQQKVDILRRIVCARRLKSGGPWGSPVTRGSGDDTSMSSDRRMAGSEADADASEAEAAGGEPLILFPLLDPASMPLSESALCPATAAMAAAVGVALGKGTASDASQLPDPNHAGSSLTARCCLRGLSTWSVSCHSNTLTEVGQPRRLWQG